MFWANFRFFSRHSTSNGFPCPGNISAGCNEMIFCHDCKNAVLSSAHIVILCLLGNPFIAASPQNKWPLFNNSEMESEVCPAVSIILPSNILSNRTFIIFVYRNYSVFKTLHICGNLCCPFPNIRITLQNASASMFVQPPANEFCPLRRVSKPLSLIITLTSRLSYKS